jgi:hypothetical protein
MHFGGVENIGKETVDASPSTFERGFQVQTVTRRRAISLKASKRLMDYWMHRFPHLESPVGDSIFNHVLKRRRMVPFGTEGKSDSYPGDSARLGQFNVWEEAAKDLLDWFGALGNGFDAVQSMLKEQVFEVLGPVIPKKHKTQ